MIFSRQGMSRRCVMLCLRVEAIYYQSRRRRRRISFAMMSWAIDVDDIDREPEKMLYAAQHATASAIKEVLRARRAPSLSVTDCQSRIISV